MPLPENVAGVEKRGIGKKLFFKEKDRDKRIFLEFQSVNIGAIVYVNGRAIQGDFKAKQPGPVTHVGSFMPFVVDITDYIKWKKKTRLQSEYLILRIHFSRGRASVKMKVLDKRWVE